MNVRYVIGIFSAMREYTQPESAQMEILALVWI